MLPSKDNLNYLSYMPNANIVGQMPHTFTSQTQVRRQEKLMKGTTYVSSVSWSLNRRVSYYTPERTLVLVSMGVEIHGASASMGIMGST